MENFFWDKYSEDLVKNVEATIQELTDKHVKVFVDHLKKKEAEIMKV